LISQTLSRAKMMYATLLLTVAAMTGAPPQRAALMQHLEVQPDGKMAKPSLLQTNTNNDVFLQTGFRGLKAADDSLTSTLATTETREKAEIDSSALQRAEKTFTKAEANVAVQEAAEEIINKVHEDEAELQSQASTEQQQEQMVVQEQHAESDSRKAGNEISSLFGALKDQVHHLSGATETLAQTSGVTSSASQDLTNDKAVERNGLADQQGKLDLLSQEVAGIQEVIGDRLNSLSKTTEATSKNALLMTGTLNGNAGFIKEAVNLLTRLDSQASTVIDAVVGVMKQTHKVEQAREQMDKEKSESKK